MIIRNAGGIGLTLLAVAGALAWAAPDTAPADPAGPAMDKPLSAMLIDLEERASEFEQRKDVKCWTSFRQLETFVAGRQLTPATTHLKTEVVINYLDQVWKAASDLAAGTTIEAEEFTRAAVDAFPSEISGILDYTLRLGDLTLTIPYHDFDNYLNTIEPIRVVQTLALRVADRDPERRPLSSEADGSAIHLAALMSTAVLKQANAQAAGNGHGEIQEMDVQEADRLLALAAGVAPYDPSAELPASTADPSEAERLRQAMTTTILSKIASLDEFNTRYSRDILQREFESDLSAKEAEWAGIPVGRDASGLARETILVSLAKDLYLVCAAAHPGRNPLTGPDMLETLQALYPHVTTIDGQVNMFPLQAGLANSWVDEFEADTFRDSGWHWKALQLGVDGIPDARALPAMDLYALEELSEFLSLYAVNLFKAAGTLAGEAGKSNVDSSTLADAHRAFTRSRQIHVESGTDDAGSPAGDDRWRDEIGAVREELQRAYIDEPFTDVTRASNVAFRHESSEMVEHYRFSPDSSAARLSSGVNIGQRRYGNTDEQREGRYPYLAVGMAGGGVAVSDVDGDGLLDIYLVSGKGDALYRNVGDMQFEDVTVSSGLGSGAEGRGAYFADFDNDGDEDLLVTQVYAPNRLYANRGGTYVDVTEETGLPLREDLISHSAMWFDFDNDGFLDIYVGNFGDWLADARPYLGHDSRNGQPNQLFRSDGSGRFEDITERSGAGDTRWCHALSHLDANNDGWQDIYLSNDFGEDVLLLNDHGKGLVDATPESLRRAFLHGMSVGLTDYNGDLVEDIYVSNIATFSFASKYITPGRETPIITNERTVKDMRVIENNLFLVSEGSTYRERHNELFDRGPQGCGWAWDADFFDFDNDGQEDLYVVNGREPNLPSDGERNVLFKRRGDHYYDVSSHSGADYPSNARGTAYADFDGDGDLDIVVNNYLGAAVLLRNNLQRNNWFEVQLHGVASNRDAIGARVTLDAGGVRQIRTVRGGSGFLSQNPFPLHFGLQDTGTIDRVEIRWPSGRVQVLSGLDANRVHHISEPS